MKSSSITFLTLAFSIIFFSAFIAAFPEGINFAKKHSIEVYDGKITFYGGLRAKGGAQVYARNATLSHDNMSQKIGYLKFVGNGNFTFPSILYREGRAYAREMECNARGYVNIDGNKTYGDFSFKIDGEIAVNFTHLNATFFQAKEEFSTFMGNTHVGEDEEIKKLLTALDILPISINKIFYIPEGNGTIDGNKIKFNKLIFRGDASFNKKLDASSYLIINNKKFYENDKKVNLKFISIPVKIIILWIIAIALFIAHLFIKREQKEMDKNFYGAAIIIEFLFVAISFYLWEKQASIIFGESFSGIGKSLSSITGMIFLFIPYMELVALIAFPIRISISSAFSFFGLNNIGRIIGRGVGYIACIWMGVILLPAILNMVLSPLLSII